MVSVPSEDPEKWMPGKGQTLAVTPTSRLWDEYNWAFWPEPIYFVVSRLLWGPHYILVSAFSDSPAVLPLTPSNYLSPSFCLSLVTLPPVCPSHSQSALSLSILIDTAALSRALLISLWSYFTKYVSSTYMYFSPGVEYVLLRNYKNVYTVQIFIISVRISP